MTEAEWLEGARPGPMLEYLHGRASARKLRLFGHACWHRLRHLLADERLREFVRVLERHADGLVSAQELTAAREAARAYLGEAPTASPREWAVCGRLVRWGSSGKAWRVAEQAAKAGRQAAAWIGDWAVAAEAKAQRDLLHDVFGNPFRPAAVEPCWLAWNGGVIRRLAEAVYEERAFDRLPVLADALEEAGCTDPDILAHCRGQNGHVRGCWVVDSLPGRG